MLSNVLTKEEAIVAINSFLNNLVGYASTNINNISNVIYWFLVIFLLYATLIILRGLLKLLKNKVILFKKKLIGLRGELLIYKESGLYSPVEFMDIFERLKLSWKNSFEFFLQAGVFLLHPSKTKIRKKYFGDILYFKTTDESNEITQQGIKIRVVKGVFIPKKLTKISVELTNNTDEPIFPRLNRDDKLSDKINICIGKNQIIGLVETLPSEIFKSHNNSKNDNENSLIQISPNQTMKVDLYFPLLKKKQIRGTNKVDLFISFRTKKGVLIEADFTIMMPKDPEIESLLEHEIDMSTVFVMFSLGGFFILWVPITLIVKIILGIIQLDFLYLIIGPIIWLVLVYLNIRMGQIIYDKLRHKYNLY